MATKQHNAQSIDLAGLVERRELIQKKLLKLHQFGETLKGSARKNPVFGLLIGAAFSLWRAVFLALPKKGYKEEYSHGMQFLKRLIETNAVTFTQDRDAAQWVGGYYIYNAAFRLSALPDIDASRKIIAKVWTNGEKKTLQNLHPKKTYDNERNPMDEWDQVFNGLKVGFALLKRATRAK